MGRQNIRFYENLDDNITLEIENEEDIDNHSGDGSIMVNGINHLY